MGDVRIVLDTDVVVAGLRSPTGASAQLLLLAEAGAFTLLVSVPLALEYEAICQLPEHRLAANLSQTDVAAFSDTLLGLADPVKIHYRWRPQLRDAGNEMVLETAVNGGADWLVSFNQRDYGSALDRFGIKVLLPRDALKRIQS